MATRHELTGQALDLAIAGKAEPRTEWKALLPPADLGKMVDAGSANIPLFALVAALVFGPSPWAKNVLRTYAAACRKRFFLAEPWSRIYGRAIVISWACVVLLARRIGDAELAAIFMELLRSFLGTARLMAARLRVAPPGATNIEKARVGSLVVCIPGCRSWGGPALHSGFDSLLHVALGTVEPRAKGKPGDLDDWGWVDRAVVACRSILLEAGQDFRGDLTWKQIVDRTPKWAARETFELFGWEDGARLATMGGDEPAVVDEDDNSNTPGTLAKGVLNGALVVAPGWPDPLTGKTHVRQKAIEADIDGDPSRGWTLRHSDFGEVVIDGAKVTFIPPYTQARLLFAFRIEAGNPDWIDLLKAEVPPDPTPAPDPPKPPREKPSWIERAGI